VSPSPSSASGATWPPRVLVAPHGAARPRRSPHRRAFGRRPTTTRRALGPVALLVVAVVAGLIAAAVVDDATRRQDAWGTTRRVAVATRDLDPGAVVVADAFEWIDRPIVVLPDGAGEADGAAVAADPGGRVVLQPVLRGEVIPLRRLAPAGARGLAALVPPQRVALAVPSDARTPPVEVGQSVDLYATPDDRGDRSAATAGVGAGVGAPTTRRLARRAPIVHVGERQLTVAVSDAEADAVAAALIEGTVIVALTAP